MKKNRKLSNRIGRNETCPCGSQVKFKRCHGKSPDDSCVVAKQQYVDSGETPVRWVIANETATAFFSDIKNRILVFEDKKLAISVINLEIFANAGPNEINLAGVGPTKWQHLQETLPFIEVPSLEMAQALLMERISGKSAELMTDADDNSTST